MEKNEALAKAREIITRVNVSALITLDPHGFPTVRPMGTLKVDEDFTVWFATSAHSAKCEEIAANPKVSVYWEQGGEDMGNYGWVLVKGIAELLRDEPTLDRFWRDEWVTYFPQGRSDPTYAIMRVTGCCLKVLPIGGHAAQTVPLDPGCACCGATCEE
ncbi:MAG: pyridoxamine 5'-phosphate oxidase family protein [Candidatus Zipacnadales bacterium]